MPDGDSQETFLSHLIELRSRLVRSLDIHSVPANEPAAALPPAASPQLELGIDEPSPPAPRDRAAG